MLTYEFLDPDIILASPSFNFTFGFLSSTRRTKVGWHYVTDIAWIHDKVKSWPRTFKVLDAGGGRGPIQFLLAEMGFDVTNVDLLHPRPPVAYRSRYGTRLRQLGSYTPTSYRRFLLAFAGQRGAKGIVKAVAKFALAGAIETIMARRWRTKVALRTTHPGRIEWVTGNLCSMPEIPSQSFDAIVSLSALEHIPFEQLPQALSEIRRVLKQEARWAVTTSGTERKDTWYHAPSQGNCFSETDLQELFGARPFMAENAGSVLARYRNCSFLKEHLAPFYKRSGDNGMPWGKWNPAYIPIGLSTSGGQG
jgi:SAM-dependent methyltransferase